MSEVRDRDYHECRISTVFMSGLQVKMITVQVSSIMTCSGLESSYTFSLGFIHLI